MEYLITKIIDTNKTTNFSFINPNNRKVNNGEASLFTKPGFSWSEDKGFYKSDSKDYVLIYGFTEIQDKTQFCSINEDNKIIEIRKKIYFLISQWNRDNKK